MPVTYRPAPEAEKIGRQLIRDHHPDIENERVEFIFRSQGAKTAGKTIWGKARKISGLGAYLATQATQATLTIGGAEFDVTDKVDPFFVVELAEDVWTHLSGKQRIALVDHELSHCRIRPTDNGAVLTVAPHDLEEFEEVVKRHGFWRSEVRHFAKVCADSDQMSLLDEDGGE